MVTKTKSKAKVHIAHFSISGEALTHLARQRLLEDEPGSAWRIATSIIPTSGMGVSDAALKVLQGKAKFVGADSNLKLVDEAWTKGVDSKPKDLKTRGYLKQVDWLYAGRMKLNGKWCRPKAVVTDFGPLDLRNQHGKEVHRISHTETKDGKGGYTNRVWHYCYQDEFAPMSEYHNNEHVNYIFEACTERPFWQLPPMSVAAAVLEIGIRDYAIEERGHSKWYGDDEKQWQYIEEQRLGGHDFPGYQEWLDNQGRGRNSGLRVDEVEEAEELINDPNVDIELTRLENRIKFDAQRERDLAELASNEVLNKQREEKYKQRLVELRAQILKQAGDNLIELTWGDGHHTDVFTGETIALTGGKTKVPKAPFMRWAFGRIERYKDKLPAWDAVSRSGMKMALDDPNHTDWVIGGGFDPADYDTVYYPSPMAKAALEKASELQDEFDDPEVIAFLVEPGVVTETVTKSIKVFVLVDGPAVVGKVVHGKPNKECLVGSIVVLPNLHPRYLKSVSKAAAVITENGGATAHLAQVGREKLLPMVLVEDALDKYPEGCELAINTAERLLTRL